MLGMKALQVPSLLLLILILLFQSNQRDQEHEQEKSECSLTTFVADKVFHRLTTPDKGNIFTLDQRFRRKRP